MMEDVISNGGESRKRKAEDATSPRRSPRRKSVQAEADIPSIDEKMEDAALMHVFFFRARLRHILEARSQKNNSKHHKHRPKELVVINCDNPITIADAVKLLAENHILSAPVVRTATEEEKHDLQKHWQGMKCVGVLDLHTVLRLLTEAVNETDEGISDWKNVETAAGHVWSRQVLDVVEGTMSDVAFLRHAYDATVEDALRYASRDKIGPIHRILMCDENGELKDIISQSDLVHFIYHNLDRLGHLSAKTVAELNLGPTRDLLCVPRTASAAEAFDLMQKRGLSRVGVLDEVGRLVGNLSVSDLRGMQPKDFYAISFPIPDFLSMRGRKVEVYSCENNTPFKDVLKLVTQHRIHAVWVVKGDESPARVITLTDIIDKLRPE